MRHKRLIIALLTLLLLSSCSRKEDYGDALEEWLGQYDCSFDTCLSGGQPDDAATAYTCVTRDSRKIEFTASCRDGYVEVPFAFHLPAKEVKIEDDFAEAVDDYLSTSIGPIDADACTIDDVVDVIMGYMEMAEELFDEYGIKGEIPSLRFAVLWCGREYTFVCGNQNRSLIKDGLVKTIMQ